MTFQDKPLDGTPRQTLSMTLQDKPLDVIRTKHFTLALRMLIARVKEM